MLQVRCTVLEEIDTEGKRVEMDKQIGAIMIIVVCGIVLLIVALRKKSELIINFVLRSITGTVMIYFLNEACIWQNLPYEISVNIASVLTAGILGFPGVLLLYGIKIYWLL